MGEGVPVSVWSHGLTGSTDELRPLAIHTAGTRVLMDLRGHGDSGTPPEGAGYDHPAMRKDIEAVADMAGATRAVGLSVSAGALLNLLADVPDRFERVVLFSPASIDGPNVGAEGLFPLFADELETMPLAEVAQRQASMDSPLYEARPYWRELVRTRTLRMNAVGVPRALRAYVNGRPPVEDPSVLARVTAPVLILAHEGDATHDSAHARRLASIFPNARLEMWPETLAMFDDEDALARLIGDFLAG